MSEVSKTISAGDIGLIRFGFVNREIQNSVRRVSRDVACSLRTRSAIRSLLQKEQGTAHVVREVVTQWLVRRSWDPGCVSRKHRKVFVPEKPTLNVRS